MKHKSSNSLARIFAATTPELFADAPAFKLVSETITVAKATPPIIQSQLFATSEILSFPPTKLDCHNNGNAHGERRLP